ncbi:MAG: acriflavin resistance protein, partial [Propionibacteriaceae bacterium]
MSPRRVTGGRLAWLGSLPFLAYVGLFLLAPTVIVAVGAFTDAANRPTLANIRVLGQRTVLDSFANSIALSAASAVIGAD